MRRRGVAIATLLLLLGPEVRARAEGAMHAQKLAFKHPRTDEWVRCEAPIPKDFRRALDLLEDA